MKNKKYMKGIICIMVALSFLLPAGITTADDPDSDGDGWTDDQEINIYFTDPYDPDTDDDGISDPDDVDPLVDLEVTVKVKRVYASEYTYTWREGETWDSCSKTIIFNDFKQYDLQSAKEVVSLILGDGSISTSVKKVFSDISPEIIKDQSAEEVVSLIPDDRSISTSVKAEIHSIFSAKDWKILSHPEASNGQYTRQYNRNGVNDWAEWDFTVNKAGVYHIWIRSHRYEDACSNVWPMWNGEDFFVKTWDDTWPRFFPLFHGPAYDICWHQPDSVSELWQWTWYGAVNMEDGESSLRIENRYESPVFERPGNPQDFITVDNILITDDPNCVPTGKGVEGEEDTTIGYAQPPEFDSQTPPDFYVKTIIAGTTDQSPIWYNDYNVLEDWSTTVDVPDDDEAVPLTIELWDEDGATDQLCDISPIGQTCNIVYNLESGTWTGDDSLADIDFIGRTSGEVDGEWDFDANVIFEISQNDYDNDGITYWQEVWGPYDGSISPLERNDRYAVIVGAGASCKLMQKNDIGSTMYPYKGTYLRYEQGYDWTDYTFYVDLMTNELVPDGYNEDIGVMFRYQDEDNYYLLRWEQNEDNDRMVLWKFVDGVKTDLGEVYTDLEENQWYTLKIVLSGNHISVWKNKNMPLNGFVEMWTIVFNLDDSSLSSGSIGLFTWKNKGARFDDILVENPDGDILLSEGFDYERKDRWTIVDEASGSSQWELTQLSADQEDFYIGPDFAYRALRLAAHYDENDIVYLSADKWRDADGDGINDVNDVCVKDSVEYLLEDWLSDRSDSNDLNLIYIFDHGSYSELEGSFVGLDSDRDGYVWDSAIMFPDSVPIDTEAHIRGWEVDIWLPYYGDGGISRLTFIMEACLIGHFIDTLSHQGENRIIIPSTTWDGSASGETGSDWPAFSFNLFRILASGEENLAAAFNEAYDFVTTENYLSIACEQDPKLDDNGDGVGHDNLPNGGDGYLAAVTGL